MACGLFRCRGKYGCQCTYVTVRAPPSTRPTAHAVREEIEKKLSDAVSEGVPDEVFKIFQYFDEDGNGKIDRGELASVLQKLDGEYWDMRRIRALFRAADLDRDQMISWSEFLDWIFKRGAEQQTLRSSLPALETLEVFQPRKQKIMSDHLASLRNAVTPEDFAARKEKAAPFFSAEEMRSHEQKFKEKMRFYFECSVYAVTSTAKSWDFQRDTTKSFYGGRLDRDIERARPFFTADEMRSHEEQYREKIRSIYKDKLMEVQTLDAFDHIRKHADFEAFFTADEMRSHEVEFKESRRANFRATFKQVQTCAAFRGTRRSPMVDVLFSADEIQNFEEQFKQRFEATKLEGAESAITLSQALKDAKDVFQPHELAKHEKQLETWRVPFPLTISTLAGSTCTVEATREQKVSSLCLEVASQLGVDPKFQKVLLVHTKGRLEPDWNSLEACGVVSSDVQLAAQLSLTREGEARERKLEEERAAEERLRKETEERRAASHRKHTAHFEALTFDELVAQARHVGLLQEADIVPGHQQALLMKHLSLASAVEDCEADLLVLDSKCSDLESEMKSLTEANEHIEKQQIQPIIDEWSPILDPAMIAVQEVTARDIAEIKCIKLPPEAAKQTLTAVCILFGRKPARVKNEFGRFYEDYWGPSINMLGNRSFLADLQKFDKDNIPPGFIKRLTHLVPEVADDSGSILEKAQVFSKATGAICMWARAMYQYHTNVHEALSPFRANISDNNTLMNAAQEQLRSQQEERQQVLGDLAHFRRALEGQAPLRRA